MLFTHLHLGFPTGLFLSGFLTNNLYVYLKNAVFWDVTPCGFCKNRRFGGT
jgi:hypothetical protein